MRRNLYVDFSFQISNGYAIVVDNNCKSVEKINKKIVVILLN